MQKMILYFCNLSSSSRERHVIEKFKEGEEPDYYAWLLEQAENYVILNHSITYYKQKIEKDELSSN